VPGSLVPNATNCPTGSASGKGNASDSAAGILPGATQQLAADRSVAKGEMDAEIKGGVRRVIISTLIIDQP